MYVIKAHEKIDQRCFSAAGGSYDGNALSGLYGKIQVLDQGYLRRIREIYIFQKDPAFRLCEHDCILGLCGSGGLIDQGKDPGSGCDRILEFRQYAGNIVKRLVY